MMDIPTINSPTPLAFMLVGVLADLTGVKSIKDLDGCWECAVDERWKFAVNGHREPFYYSGMAVPPYCMAVELNGVVVGCLNPFGGAMLASEDDFIAALALRVRRETDDGEYPAFLAEAFKGAGMELLP